MVFLLIMPTPHPCAPVPKFVISGSHNSTMIRPCPCPLAACCAPLPQLPSPARPRSPSPTPPSPCPPQQVISGSHDSTVRLWDLRRGKASGVLTHHKKSIRAMAMHPAEFAFASASAENIKKWALPDGDFLHNMLAQQRAIVNAMALNADGVMATGGWKGVGRGTRG